MKISIVSDDFTRLSINSYENLNTLKITDIFKKPLFLFVESAWLGQRKKWKYKIASYPNFPSRNNKKLVNLVCRAKNKGIPTVFWNKEDGIHFHRFIDSARHFDHILTVDSNCIEKYKSEGDFKSVNTMIFLYSPNFIPLMDLN